MWCNRCWVWRSTCRHLTLQTDCNLLLEATSHLIWQTPSEVSEKRLGYRAEVSSQLACIFPFHFQVISKREKSQIMLLQAALTGWCTVVYVFLLTLQPRGGSSAQGSTGLSSEIVRLGDGLYHPIWHALFLKNSDKGGKFAFTLALWKQLVLSYCHLSLCTKRLL